MTVTLHRAGARDAAPLDAFLAQHPATSMFLRANLASHGTDDTTNPHGTAFYLSEVAGAITGVFGITNAGYLLAQAPDAPPEAWDAFARAIKGRTVAGMTGRPVQVQQCLGACGMTLGPWAVLADDPIYHLMLCDLVDMPGQVRSPVPADIPLLEQWYATYALDTGQALDDQTISPEIAARAARAVGSEDVVILEERGVPVAMAGVNARLADTVQLGGVFTPDGLRGNGYARRAVAGLLRRCAAQGVTQSVLFANNDAAAQAYETLGYRRVGDYRVAILATPACIGEVT